MEAAIGKIAEHIQRKAVFNESSRTSTNGLTDEVKEHQENFLQMATILHIHEQHISRSGVISQEIAQFVNALIHENEKRLLIESLVEEPGTNRGHSATRD